MNRKVSILGVVMIAVMSVTTVAVAFAAQGGVGRGLPKVTLCHNGHTITVGAPAAEAHLNHHPDDTEGACPPDAETPEPPEETTMPGTTMMDTTMMDTTMMDTTMPDTVASENEGSLGGQTDNSDGVKHGVDLYGDSAADELRGGPRANFLQGGRGPDRMFGAGSNDYIDGVDGIAGNDELDGGWGIDRCVGDEGDTFVKCDGNVVEVPVPPGTSALKTAGH